MGKKKVLSIAAVSAAAAGAVAFVVAKARRTPEAASEAYESTKDTVREAPKKAAAAVNAVKDRISGKGEPDGEEEIDDLDKAIDEEAPGKENPAEGHE